jgi:hypothetical protein
MNFNELNEIEGLQFMPVLENKRPIIKGWQTSSEKHDMSNCAGVGLVCGKLSGGLEVIDVDAKYSLDGKLFEKYKKLIHQADDTLLAKLAVQKTKGGGYHMIYRCSVISGNLKLANRHTTKEEKQATYDETYQAEIMKSDDVEARKKAQKASENDKVRVLLETRGEGGYIMCFPSKGYEFIHNDFYAIFEITPEQREILHSCARQLNEVFEEVIVPKTTSIKKTKGLSVFDDYNERGDVVALLESHGWKVVGRRSNAKKTQLQRAGQTTAQTSGNFDHDLNRFSVFTTSTQFEPMRGYMRYAVFAILECNGDFSEASRRLYEMGYGERDEKAVKEKAQSTRVIQSRVNVEDDDLSFLATGADYDKYLQQVIDGTLPMGLTTGSPSLDEYFLFKEGNLVMFNGHDNVGKSVWVWWLMMISSMYHGWRWLVFSSENTLGSFMRKQIQFYHGKPLRGYDAQTSSEFKEAKKFVEEHFKLIKHEENLFNYKDIMNMYKKARKSFPEYQHGLIDPYNSLKTDLSGFSKLSTHDYHYEAMSELQSDCQANGFTWFVNHHVITEATRKTDADGYQVAPNKADTEGGAKIANKAHDFVTVHRKTNHPQDFNVTEAHVRKIKDTETGGKPTPLTSPVKFRMTKHQSAFEEVREDGIPPVDPIARWHQTQDAIKAGQPEFKHWADRDDYMTLEQFRELNAAEEQRANTIVPLRSGGEIIADVPKKAFDNYEPLEGYIPDDEERAALEELLKKDKPF